MSNQKDDKEVKKEEVVAPKAAPPTPTVSATGVKEFPVPPVPDGDFTSVQQIVIPEAEIRGTVPQGRHCTGNNPGGTNSLSYTGINFIQPNALCVVIDIPADIPAGAHGWCDVYEYIDGPDKRWASLSETPFDWDGLPGWPTSVSKGASSFKATMQIGLAAPDPASAVIGVQAGKTYYLNVSNHDPKNPKNHGSGWEDPRNVGVEMSAIRVYP
jgi:hypothetical protein